MIISNYSKILTINDKNYFFNTYNSALIELDEMTFGKIKEANCRNINVEYIFNNEEKDLLISEGFIVDKEEESRRKFLIKMNYHRSKYKPTKTLKIDIGITDKCNFACTYCFENGNKNTNKFCANQFTQAELFSELRKYILKHVNSEVTNVEVVWYGGEPSLEWDFICFANRKLLNDAAEYGYRYSNIIITNGFYITEEYVNILKNQNIKYMQITIDGLKEKHNNRRNTVPKVNSFDIILNNIDMLIKNNIEVVIRINIDLDNILEISNLLDFLSNKFGKDVIGRLLFVNFGRVFGSTSSLTYEEYESIYHDLYIKASQIGFIEPEFEAHEVGAFCGAEMINDNVVIDFMGNKYKCWNDIFDQSRIVGNIYNENDNYINNSSVDTEMCYMEQLSLDNINDGKCLSCEFIKYCGGLCPYNRKLIIEEEDENIYIEDACKKIVKKRIETHIEAYINKLSLNKEQVTCENS